ncbi:MAG: NADH-ubiquinone oxidoreductase-F iron-sulfur binding region domain-containing protein [Oscillospiraceae bacterium]
MKKDKTPGLLPYLRVELEKNGSLSRKALAGAAGRFGLSYAQAAGRAGFYSLVNGLPAEERLSPEVKRSGPLLAHGEERPWAGLRKARSAPGAILDELRRSGLGGRGGGGFPAADKWKAVRAAPGERKYVVCNVSEGEPGTAKDLLLLLRRPQAVLEGMAICALAVGAEEGYVYVRAGYGDAAEALRRALAESRGELGSFSLRVVENLGAYVCGEETALLASLEGCRGEPAKKPPFPTEQGFMSCPTVVNNAETFACVPLILDGGGDAFAAGETRLYTVSGCGARAAVCEMSVRARPREIFAAAGCAGSVKALQIGGGASGPLFPARCLDVPFLSEEAGRLGMSPGAGGIRFLSAGESVAGLCRDTAEFFANESCGKCTPCRCGCQKLRDMLAEGASPRQMEALAVYIRQNAFCALGKSAGNTLLSALRYFPEEFDCPEEEVTWI